MVIFNEILGIKEPDDRMRINRRISIKGVIIKDGRILMVHSNKGDYKFPGGGMHIGENHADALKREVEEETGRIVINIKENIGLIIERKIDKYEEDTIFEMDSYYYSCEVSDKETSQKLDQYEAEQEFSPVWISIDEAIRLNEEALKHSDKNAWVYRENLALKQLKKHMRMQQD